MAVGMMFLLWSMNVFIKAVGLGNSSCSGVEVCGNVTIPYPFGIEPGCYFDDSFAIYCNKTLEKPFLRNIDLEVLNISLEGTLRVNYPMSWWCPQTKTQRETQRVANMSLASSPYFFSRLRNIFIAMGCDNLSLLESSDGSCIGGCMSVCEKEKDTKQTNGRSCDGIDCCKTTIPSDLDAFNVARVLFANQAPSETSKDCKYTSLVDQKWFEKNSKNHFKVRKMSYVPVVLNWEINADLSIFIMGSNSSHSTCQFANGSSLFGNVSSTFTCTCDSGFEGNPYLLDGCQGKLLALF